MRAVVNISLPIPLARVVNQEIKTGKYASKSEFFRTLLRSWIEERLAKELASSQKELASGQGKLLKSLKDLR